MLWAKTDKKKHRTRIGLWFMSLWMLSVLMLALLVHLVAILLLPKYARDQVASRLATAAPLNQWTLIAPDTLPFEDATEVLAVCRYDLADRPLRLSGRSPGGLLVILSFQTQSAQNFYGLTDRAAQREKLDVLLALPAQLEAIESEESEDEVPQDLRLEAPAAQGFILVRAIAERAALREEAQNALAGFSCKPI